MGRDATRRLQGVCPSGPHLLHALMKPDELPGIRSFLANVNIQPWKDTIVIRSTNCLGRDTRGCDKPEWEGDISSNAGIRSVLKWGKST